MLRAIQAIAFAVVLHPTAAMAEVRRFALDYQGTASCPSEVELLAEVQRRAPHTEQVLATGPHEVRARIRVEAHGERQSGTIDIDTGEGTTHREIEAAECAQVVHALALILAMAVDPDAAAGEPQESAKIQPAIAAPPRPAAPSRSLEFWWATGAGIGLTGGVAPSPSLSEGLFLELGRGRDPGLSANVRLAGVHAHGSAAARAGSADFDLLGLRLATCPYRVGARLVLSGCVSFDWGRLRGSGSRTLAAQASSARWLGPGGFVDAALQVLPWIHLQLELGALLPLARDRFYFGPDDTVHRIPSVAGYSGLNVLVGG